jgi:hypothetical protein
LLTANTVFAVNDAVSKDFARINGGLNKETDKRIALSLYPRQTRFIYSLVELYSVKRSRDR